MRLPLCRILQIAASFGFIVSPALSAQSDPDVVWRSRSTDPTPTGLFNFEVAYDDLRGEMVLISQEVPATGTPGGSPATWLWDGIEMRRETPMVRPSFRRVHQMCFDPTRGVVVLFGGVFNGSGRDETWEWDGTSWELRQEDTGPVGVGGVFSESDMAFDAVRGTCVLYRTFDGLDNETWEWDGSNWTQLSTLSTPMFLGNESLDQQMITHPESGRVVCFTLQQPAALYELRDGPAGLDWVPLPSSVDPSLNLVEQSMFARSHLFVGPGGGLFVMVWEVGQSRLTTLRQEDDGVFRRVPLVPRIGSTERSARAIYDPRRDVTVFFSGPNTEMDVYELYDASVDFPANVSVYGESCSDTLSSFGYVGELPPRLGATVELYVLNPLGVPSSTLIGLSNEAFGATPLPLDLDVFGATGCQLLTSAECSVSNRQIIPVVSVLPITFPNDPSLLSLSLYCQAVALDSAANPLGVALSHGIELRIEF